MISRSASRRIRRERMGATRIRERANRAKARHLAAMAVKIEKARSVGKPVRVNGRFVGARALYTRITKLLGSGRRAPQSLTPSAA